MSLALDDVAEVLRAVGTSLADVVRLTSCTTDVDASAPAGVLAQRLAAAGARPLPTLPVVSRPALPEPLVEPAATAVA